MDLSAPVRAAVLGEPLILAELAAYLDSYPVFTRAPVPADAPYPMIVTPYQLGGGEEDGLTDERPIIVRDVITYAQNDTAAKSRAADRIALMLRDVFHRNPSALAVDGWKVVSIVALGPSPAPTDDEQTVGRRVELTVRLARKIESYGLREDGGYALREDGGFELRE